MKEKLLTNGMTCRKTEDLATKAEQMTWAAEQVAQTGTAAAS